MKMFPSPYGDMVLKYCGKIAVSSIVRVVSVPLRGYGFEISFTREHTSTNFEKSFRPLTGIWF